MGIRKRWLCVLIFSASICQLQAQDADSLLSSPSDSTALSYSDSLSIFYLIDSLLILEENTLGSQLAVRLNYNSNVLSTGRTLGIDQFGLSPGVSFYHTSGFYADVSSFWSNDFDPNYYLTILSLGYSHLFSSKFSLTGNYDRYIYNLPDEYVPYANGITISPVLDLKYFSIQCDYTYYFGETDANRIMPSISINLSKKKLLGMDKVSFNPGFYVLFGDESFTKIYLPTTREEWIQAYIRMSRGLTWYTTEAYTEFGIMNYSFSLPLNIQYKKFNLNISYVYSIPKALPSETLLLTETGFVSAGITYLINLKKNKSPF
jgi:hypothetical protein